MGVPNNRDDDQSSSPPCAAYRPPRARRPPSTSSDTPVKTRRPDREVYVPRARRSHAPAAPAAAIPAAVSAAPATPPRRAPDKAFCNVYRPPHAREDGADGGAAPAAGAGHPGDAAHDPAQHVSGPRRIMGPPDKDEDTDGRELRRATREINRSNRRLIKQSFPSDELVISAPAPAEEAPGDGAAERAARVFDPAEHDWEAMLDEDGECLEPALLAELAQAVGRVTVQSPREPPPTLEPSPLSHVLEVYDFPAQFRELDLLAVFSDFKDTGFEIKWVDDNHALLVFSSTKIAQEVLAYSHPMVRTRSLQEATQESRNKARRCAGGLQPYRTRPETCAALARRLVTGALGLRLPTASQERLEERRLLTQAREKKRLAARHREAAWDGSLADTS